MPPAFALSQDQTLRFIFMRTPRDIHINPNRSGPAHLKGCSSSSLTEESQTHILTSVSVTSSKKIHHSDTHKDKPMTIKPDQSSPTPRAAESNPPTGDELPGRRQRIPS